MKKKCILLTIFCLLIFALGACNQKADDSNSSDDKKTLQELISSNSKDVETNLDDSNDANNTLNSSSFEESQAFLLMKETLDEKYKNFPHQISYDNSTKELNIYIEMPEKSRAGLATKNKDLLDSWDTLRKSLLAVYKPVLEILSIENAGDVLNIYLVDKLYDNDGDYSISDYLLWIRNDTIMYDVAND